MDIDPAFQRVEAGLPTGGEEEEDGRHVPTIAVNTRLVQRTTFPDEHPSRPLAQQRYAGLTSVAI